MSRQGNLVLAVLIATAVPVGVEPMAHAATSSKSVISSAVSTDGRYRCTAEFPSRTLDPAEWFRVRFRLKNRTGATVDPPRVFGFLQVRDQTGHLLYSSFPNGYGVPGGPQGSIGGGQSVDLGAMDTIVRWSGPLFVTPVCHGLDLSLPERKLYVATPGPTPTPADAIAQLLAIPASPFASCPPTEDGAVVVGAFPPPDGSSLPDLTLACWVDVREEDGFVVIDQFAVAPSTAPPYELPESFRLPPAVSLPAVPMWAGRWSFVITATRSRPYISTGLAYTENSNARSPFYSLAHGVWNKQPFRCGYQAGAALGLSRLFWLAWVQKCS